MLKITKYSLMIGFLFYLYKNYKNIFFYIYSNTYFGKKYIRKKQSDAIEIIKKNVFNKKWENNYNVLPEEGQSVKCIKRYYNNQKTVIK